MSTGASQSLITCLDVVKTYGSGNAEVHALRGVNLDVYPGEITMLAHLKISEGGGNLANSTWYYVYVWDNAGTVDYQISTTAPRASQQYKNSVDGNVYRYLGCFRTNSSGAPIPMRARRGRYVYRLSATTDPVVYNDATARGSAYDVSLAALVPPHARLARVQAIVVSSGAATYMNVFTKADVTDITWRQQAPDGTTTYGEFDIETDSSQAVQITYNVGGGSGNAKLRVTGFAE